MPIQKLLRSVGRPVRALAARIVLVRMYAARLMFGNEFVLVRFDAYSRWLGPVRVLRLLGAKVGDEVHIEPGMTVQNAKDGRLDNLTIGDHVYIGPRFLVELALPITIEDQCGMSAGVSIVTHSDIGNRPLKARFPRREGPVLVRRGAWLGINVTVLFGVTIGPYAHVGACSLVSRDIPANSFCMGTPARVLQVFTDELSQRSGASP